MDEEQISIYNIVYTWGEGRENGQLVLMKSYLGGSWWVPVVLGYEIVHTFGDAVN